MTTAKDPAPKAGAASATKVDTKPAESAPGADHGGKDPAAKAGAASKAQVDAGAEKK